MSAGQLHVSVAENCLGLPAAALKTVLLITEAALLRNDLRFVPGGGSRVQLMKN